MKYPEIVALTLNELDIQPDTVAKIAGYEPSDPSDQILPLIKHLIITGNDLFDIRGCYQVLSDVHLNQEQQILRCESVTFNTNKVVSRQLGGSERIAVFLCTTGDEVSSKINQYFNTGDTLEGYLLDILCNVVLDSAMDQIQMNLSKEMNQHSLKITNRYSPGYCDWDISEQKKLFSLFPDNMLEISLTPSYLMIPVKSVSGIIGIGKNVRYQTTTCNLCNQKSCSYRNITNK